MANTAVFQPAGGPSYLSHQAAFVFIVILARSSLHNALMRLEWTFGRKQWHLSSLLHQDSNSEPGLWPSISSLLCLFLLTGWVIDHSVLFCCTGCVKLGCSQASALQSISLSQTTFLSSTKQILTFTGKNKTALRVIHPYLLMQMVQVTVEEP